MIRFLSIGACLACTSATAAELKFSEAFADGQLGSAVVVQAPAGDVIVFDGGEYFLDGKDLVILGDMVVIRATTTIRAFSQSSTPATVPGTPATPAQAVGQEPCTGRNGCTGIKGVEGVGGAGGIQGRKAGRYVFEIGAIEAMDSIILTLDGSGQKGGRGQEGSQGGRGANGGTGHNAGEVPRCETPGRGGTGGQGGPPGAGGIGGPGGDGGRILISKPLDAAVASGKVVLLVNGGFGGDPGAVGTRGLGGAGGARGSGSHTCSHDPPPPADDGPLGQEDPIVETPPAPAGVPGIIEQLP